MDFDSTIAELKKKKELFENEVSRLDEERRVASVALGKAKSELSNVVSKLKGLQCRVAPVVTDHALVRYIERVKGIDVEALRGEILTDGRRAAIKRYGSLKIPLPDGARVVVKEGVIVTVSPKRQPKVNHSKVKPIPQFMDDDWEWQGQ